jgi:hypothetical protein
MTTVDEALAILERHQWVQTVEAPISEHSGFISVEWASAASPIIAPHTRTQLYVLAGVVYDMGIQTTYPVGTVYLLEGQPQQTDSGRSRSGAVVSAYYFDLSAIVYASVSCPVTQSKFWNSDMYLSFSDLRASTGFSAINFAC